MPTLSLPYPPLRTVSSILFAGEPARAVLCLLLGLAVASASLRLGFLFGGYFVPKRVAERAAAQRAAAESAAAEAASAQSAAADSAAAATPPPAAQPPLSVRLSAAEVEVTEMDLEEVIEEFEEARARCAQPCPMHTRPTPSALHPLSIRAERPAGAPSPPASTPACAPHVLTLCRRPRVLTHRPNPAFTLSGARPPQQQLIACSPWRDCTNLTPARFATSPVHAPFTHPDPPPPTHTSQSPAHLHLPRTPATHTYHSHLARPTRPLRRSDRSAPRASLVTPAPTLPRRWGPRPHTRAESRAGSRGWLWREPRRGGLGGSAPPEHAPGGLDCVRLVAGGRMGAGPVLASSAQSPPNPS